MNNNVKAINTMTNISSIAESVQQEVSSIGLIGFEKTQSHVKQNMEKVMKSAEEMVSFSQGNFEAIMKSGQIWVAGLQDLTKQMAATAQAHIEESVAAMKSFSAVKSLKEIVDMQTSLARTSMEKAMTESGRLTDASFKLAEQAIAPLTARVTFAVEKFGKAV